MNLDTPIALYSTADGKVALEVRLERDSVWLRQEQMSELFGRERSVITKHLLNVFKEGELEEDSVCANFAHTAVDGKNYPSPRGGGVVVCPRRGAMAALQMLKSSLIGRGEATELFARPRGDGLGSLLGNLDQWVMEWSAPLLQRAQSGHNER